jgi:hypothetical protein
MAALESQVRGLAQQGQQNRQDSAAARILAGGADRDIAQVRSEMRDFRQATTSSFNAMREDLTDLRTDLTDLRTHIDTRFAHMDTRFTKVDRGFAEVDRGFTEMRGKFDAAAAGQQQITELLSRLIARDEQDG